VELLEQLSALIYRDPMLKVSELTTSSIWLPSPFTPRIHQK
jgi:hypothetical protein